jgi:poly(A) polymerase
MKPLQFDPILESKDSKDLEQHLIDNGCLCPSNCNNDQDRKQALHVLETIVSDWTELKHSETIDNSVVLPTLITFGSYGLRVHRLDSDVDVLCLFGNNVTRGEFFSSFVEFLEKDERISKLLSIPDGFTPIVKFYLNGIHIDLLFGNVSNPTKLIEFHQKRKSSSLSTEDATGNEVDQQEYQIDDSDLIGKDEAGVRSLNGVRVTQFIEENISNLDNFRICLGTIKEWAVLNGIYSNKLGFLGGINFAILLAKVCIENPESETWPPSTLLKLFFRTYALWEWPKPVILTTRIQLDPPPQVSKMQVWDPIVNRRDAMPIITPVYPSSKLLFQLFGTTCTIPFISHTVQRHRSELKLQCKPSAASAHTRRNDQRSYHP